MYFRLASARPDHMVQSMLFGGREIDAGICQAPRFSFRGTLCMARLAQTTGGGKNIFGGRRVDLGMCYVPQALLRRIRGLVRLAQNTEVQSVLFGCRQIDLGICRAARNCIFGLALLGSPRLTFLCY